MSQIKNISGQRFGRLVALHMTSRRMGGKIAWRCQCDCGKVVDVAGASLRNRNTKSCGCINRSGRPTHGKSDSPEYIVWMGMRQRCQQLGRDDAPYYRDKGIVVCQRWESFACFFADMGPKPTARHMIDRIDGDGPYAPENCRWVTPEVQARNKRTNHFVLFDGVTRTLVEWAEITGFPYGVIKARLRLGWSTERALTEAPMKRPGAGNYKRMPTTVKEAGICTFAPEA